MPFDYKKEYRAFYQPPKVPEIIDVPEMQFVCVSGTGDPNEEGGAYQQALGVLYAVSYTLKMSPRAGHLMDGFFDYVVPPLEGFWQQDGVSGVDYGRKADFRWLSVIRVPDFVTAEDFRWAVETASEKKKLDCSRAELRTIREGLCVQMMHIGAYDDEPASVAQMDAFLREKGYENDFTAERLHHEIYLSDPRKTAAEKRKTVIRHPVRKRANRKEDVPHARKSAAFSAVSRVKASACAADSAIYALSFSSAD